MKPDSLIKICILPALLALAACGGSSGSSDPEPTSTPAPTTPPTSMPTTMPTTSPTTTPTMAPTSTPTSMPTAGVVSAKFVKSMTTMGATFSVDGNVTVLESKNGVLSKVTLDKTNFSLYTFDNDTVDSASTCTSDNCIGAWPPLLAADGDSAVAPLSIFERSDGNKQWALRGLPLYFFSSDEAGTVRGEGASDVWRTATDEPVVHIKPTVNNNDGIYLVASGEIKVSNQVNAGDNTIFAKQSANRRNMSLYTFDNDTSGVSNCNDGCLVNWPALLADEDDIATPPYSLIERAIGSNGPTAKQWALDGKPLYFFINDVNPGDTNGKAISNWRLARPVNMKASESSTEMFYVSAGLSLDAVPDGDEVTREAPRDGFALYTFDNDMAGSSACVDTCLTNWPALAAFDGAEAFGSFTVITRDSGIKQWALNGQPLYFFAKDLAPGDTNGDGVGGVWHLARSVAAPAPVTLEQLQTNIFTPNCATSGCHTGSNPPRGLHLDSVANAFNDLVNTSAVGLPSLLRVNPGNSEDSYLVRKVEGAQGIVGSQMPLGGTPLSSDQIQMIKDWIDAGAKQGTTF